MAWYYAFTWNNARSAGLDGCTQEDTRTMGDGAARPSREVPARTPRSRRQPRQRPAPGSHAHHGPAAELAAPPGARAPPRGPVP
jgi:hypothetical protein